MKTLSARLMIALWFILMILLFVAGLSGCSKPEIDPSPVLAGTTWEIRYTDTSEPWSKQLHFTEKQTAEIRMILDNRQMSYESYEYLFDSKTIWIDGPFDQNFKGVYMRDSLELQGEIYYPVKR